MTSDPRLESYLTSLERVLKPFPVGDRAEIVTEIKSHVLSALERDPQTRLDTVLAALGEPETVANRYLIERGLTPAKPPISPIVKWVVIGFLGTFAMLLIFVGVIALKFTPLLHVDDLKDKVSILGGMIEVDGEKGKVLIRGGLGDEWHETTNTFEGSISATPGQSISVKFGSGKIELNNSESSKFSWSCNSIKKGAPSATTENNLVALDLSAQGWVKCEISVPEHAKFAINGTDGKLAIEEPRYNISANLINGKVDVEPAEDHSYRYDLQVTHGKMDSFQSSDKSDAFNMAIHLVNGRISRTE